MAYVMMSDAITRKFACLRAFATDAVPHIKSATVPPGPT